MKKRSPDLIDELKKQSDKLHDISIRLEAMQNTMQKNHPDDLREWRLQVELLHQKFDPVHHKSILNIESLRVSLSSVQD